MKKREFHNLRQGGRTVGQYVEDFSKLVLGNVAENKIFLRFHQDPSMSSSSNE